MEKRNGHVEHKIEGVHSCISLELTPSRKQLLTFAPIVEFLYNILETRENPNKNTLREKNKGLPSLMRT